MSRATSSWAALAVVFAFALLMVVPTGWAQGGSSPPAVPHPTGAAARAAASPATPRPAVPAFCPNPPYGYGPTNGHLPPTPSLIGQLCMGPIQQDTVHATFGSNHPGSGERWTEPIYLPTGGNPGQWAAYSDVLLGMVVGGDVGSMFKQSYAQLVFTPTASSERPGVNWSISLDVWAFHNQSAGGNCTGSSQTVSWNYSTWCIEDMFNSSAGFTGPTVPGGTWYNVTFDGLVGAGSGMWVWANDSTNKTPANNVTLRLNATTTKGVSYEPYYNSSCPDACFLNWSFAFGLGVGYDICPWSFSLFPSCDSYNQSAWDGDPPVALGIPEYWVSAAAGYTGDYRYFEPMSGSAQCSSTAISPVAQCLDYNNNTGTGFYPYFTWNGSRFNFGDNQPWTIEAMGGEYTQYLQNGPTQDDIVPTFIDKVVDSSRAGFVRPLDPLNISAHVSDMGNVSAVNLTYTLNGSAPTTIAMTLMSGNAQRGVYNASVPSGPNGWINYTVTVQTPAPNTVTTTLAHVFRGPLPLFHVTVAGVPPGCTNVTLNGTRESNGSVVPLYPGAYPITSTSCYPHNFARYTTTPGLGVSLVSGPTGNLSVGASGTVTSVWTYFRPHVTVKFTTYPGTSCGSVTINGSTTLTAGNSTTDLLFGNPVPLASPTGCGGVSFAGWTLSGNLTVLGGTFTPGGNGTITANFVNTASSSTLEFHTTPSTCGGVVYRGAGYTNNETLQVNSTAYPVAPASCAHWGFNNFTTTGGASLAGDNLTVTSSGSVTENNYVLTEILIETFPAACELTFDGKTYGNGSVIVVQNYSNHTVQQDACPGYYVFGMTTTPGLSLFGGALLVNDSGTLYATWLPGRAPSVFLEFETDPENCGSITFLGETWFNTNYTQVPPNTSGPISAEACPNYGFVRWQVSPNAAIHNGIAYVNGTATIEAVFRPSATVSIETSPSGCGSVDLNGVTFTNNGSSQLTEDVAYPISETPCAHYSFVSWGDTIGAFVVNQTVYLTSNAILVANFAPTEYNLTVLVEPAACGSVYVNGASQTNDSVVTLPYGTYSMRPVACVGDVLVSVTGTANVTVGTKNLTLSGNATLTATFAPVPPSVTLDVPVSDYPGDAVLFTATVAVPVPPFTYNYTWSFGDGTTVTTPANFTQHAYASTGTYHVSVMVRDPYGRTAYQNATISIVPGSSTSSFALPTSTIIVLGLAGAAAIALVAVALWRRRPPTAGPAESEGPSFESAPNDGPAENPTGSAPYDDQTEQG